MALVLHLGGIDEYVNQIWGWSVHSRESGDLHPPLRQHAQYGENNVQLKDIHMIYTEKRKRENLQGKTHGLMCKSEQGWA
jgi:hypothetical protein